MCNEYEVLIQKAIDHEISEAEEAKLVAHLDVCDTCKENYEALKQLKAYLGQMEEVEIPSQFHEELMSKIRREADLALAEEKSLQKVVPLKKKKGSLRHLFKVSGTVAAAVIVGGAFFYQLSELQQPRMYSASEAAPQEEAAEEACEAPADNGKSIKMSDAVSEESNDYSEQPEMVALPSEMVFEVKVADANEMLTEAEVYLNEQGISFTIIDEEIHLSSLEDAKKLKAWFIAKGASLTEEETLIDGEAFIFRLLI